MSSGIEVRGLLPTAGFEMAFVAICVAGESIARDGE
jgi:hypothetical protein